MGYLSGHPIYFLLDPGRPVNVVSRSGLKGRRDRLTGPNGVSGLSYEKLYGDQK